MSALKNGNVTHLESYSDTALKRIRASGNIYWRLTNLLTVFRCTDAFDQKLRENDYDILLTSEPAQHALAHEYVGFPC